MNYYYQNLFPPERPELTSQLNLGKGCSTNNKPHWTAILIVATVDCSFNIKWGGGSDSDVTPCRIATVIFRKPDGFQKNSTSVLQGCNFSLFFPV